MAIHFLMLHYNSIDKEIVDSLITININDEISFINYYNNDGYWETLCINGLRWAAILLSNKLLFPYGINVNYYKVICSNTIEVKTYEKGIESMMQSCTSESFVCAYD